MCTPCYILKNSIKEERGARMADASGGAGWRVLKTWMKTVRLRGGKEKVCVYQTRAYAKGTARGQYQLWIDGRWAEDITAKVGAEPMAWSDGNSADETAEELEKLGLDDMEEQKSEEELAAALEEV